MTDGHLVKWDATALKFVDAGKSVDDFVKKTSTKGLYATEVDGSDVKINFSATPVNWQIAQYNNGGRLQTKDPTDSLNTVNKQYFEANGVLLTGGTPLSANSDLNQLSFGNYQCTDATAQTIANTPYKHGFILHCYKRSDYLVQELYGQANEFYFRTKTNTSWKSWIKLASIDDVTTATAVLIDNSLLGG